MICSYVKNSENDTKKNGESDKTKEVEGVNLSSTFMKYNPIYTLIQIYIEIYIYILTSLSCHIRIRVRMSNMISIESKVRCR